jgi:hypothetical protein
MKATRQVWQIKQKLAEARGDTQASQIIAAGGLKAAEMNEMNETQRSG